MHTPKKIEGSTGAWEVYGSGRRPIVNSYSRLEAGVYYLWESSNGVIFEPNQQFNDPVLDLPGLPNKFIRDQVEEFWKNEHKYREHGFVHKRGILLYGPPGNGKSSVIASLVKNLIEQDGIVITVSRFSMASGAIQNLKKIEPQRKLMLLMEDMDTLLSGDYKTEEPYALSLLDGQAQVNGVVFIGTTNYPEQLADRFIKRPGRFDLIIGMGNPAKEAREAYLTHILPHVPKETIDFLAEKTEGLSLSYLREIAASYLCLNVPIEESVNRLKTNYEAKLKGSGFSMRTLGFTLGYEPSASSASASASK
jgi:ATPase family associated with various cellular activities (AAA)